MDNFRLFVDEHLDNNRVLITLFVSKNLLEVIPTACFTVAEVFKIDKNWGKEVSHTCLSQKHDSGFEEYIRSRMTGVILRYKYDYLVMEKKDFNISKIMTSLTLANALDINKLKKGYLDIR